jgi:hypothetical protein
MKRVYQIFLYNIMMIVLFTLTYYLIGNEHFVNLNGKKHVEFIDCLFLATTIQCGVGLSDINTVTTLSKLLTIFQQMTMLGNTIFMLYIFSLSK